VTDTDFATDVTDMTEPTADSASAPAGSMEHVRAERVEISQGGAGIVTADSVTISQGGAGRVSATDVTISQGGVGMARTANLSLRDRSGAFAVVADEASFSDNATAFLLIARTATGTVRAVIDWRAAAAFGAAFAIVRALLRRGR
jgi:hypothetical protein